jgi:hypothetical protein
MPSEAALKVTTISSWQIMSRAQASPITHFTRPSADPWAGATSLIKCGSHSYSQQKAMLWAASGEDASRVTGCRMALNGYRIVADLTGGLAGGTGHFRDAKDNNSPVATYSA